MVAPTFPDIALGRGSRRKKFNKILTAEFGDGYEQRVPDGVNTVREEWNMSFTNRPVEEVEILMDFFDALQGTEHFSWTPPNETSEKFWVQNGDYELSFAGHETRNLSVPIKRVYRL